MDQFQEVYRKVFETTTDCVAVYKPVNNGKDFVLTDFNPAAEKAESIRRVDLLGKNVKEVFPDVVHYGLFDLLIKVARTGRSEYLPIKLYKDKKISGWRENRVHKLPDGQILVIYKDLTSIKLREEEEKVQEHIFQQFIELLPEIVCEANMEGRVLLANKKAYEKFGIKSEDIEKGLFLRELFSPSELRRATVYFEKLVRGREVSPQEYKVIRKNGTSFPVIAYVNLVYKKGKPSGILGVMIDISERKAAEKELKKEKTYLEELIAGAPEAIVQTSLDRNILKINSEFTKLFGYSQESVLGQDIDKLLGQEKYLKEAVSFSKKILKGEKVTAESIRFHENGKPVNVSILGKPIKLNGRLIGVFCIYRDITKTKKAEKLKELVSNISAAVLQFDNMEYLLNKIRQELSYFLDTTNFFIAIYNHEDHTLSFPYFVDENDKFEKVPAINTLTGYVIKTGVPQLLKTKDITALEQKGEISLVGTPSKVWLGAPLSSPDGILGVISLQSYQDENAYTKEDLGILCFISNQIGMAIYKIKIMEALEIAKQKAEEVAITKQQFLSTMSHEIRTPLNAVIGMSQLLMDTDPRPDQLEYLSALKYSGENLMALINDILDFNKLESEKVVLEKVIFPPEDVVKKTIQVLGFRATERNNSISFTIENDVPEYVLGDKIRLVQILTNLIGNAIKFTENGKIHIQVSLLSTLNKEWKLKFSVKDTGIGIEPEKQKLIFDSFTQAKSDTTRLFGGSGLGLAISKKLVEMQEGNIEVKSTLGEGSTFSFTLLYDKIDEKVTRKEKSKIKGEVDLSGKKVLIVEDNVINRLVARRFLENWGIQVEEAEHGEMAIEKVLQNRPDLILMDLQMPVMDGYEATKRIKNMENGTFHSIPVIALSASVLLDIKEEIAEAGLDGFLLKPFNAGDLQEILKKHFQ